MKRKRIDSPTRDEKSHEVNQSQTSNPGKSEDLGNNSRPTTQNHASLCEPKSTMADYVVKTIVDSVLEHIIVHQITTTKSMEPVPSSRPVQERHTTQNPATQNKSTPRKPVNEQVQRNSSPVQNNVPVQREKPILKTAVLNLKLKTKTSTIPEMFKIQEEKKTSSGRKPRPELTINKNQAPSNTKKTKISTIPDLFKVQEKETHLDKNRKAEIKPTTTRIFAQKSDGGGYPHP